MKDKNYDIFAYSPDDRILNNKNNHNHNIKAL